MAKIEISVDTKDKTVVTKVDGKKVENVGDIIVYTEDGAGFFGIDITQIERIDDNTRKTTRISANKKSREGEEGIEARAKANAKDSKNFPGLLEFEVPNFTSAQLSEALFGRDRT